MFYAVIFFTILVLGFLLFDIKKPRNFPPGPSWYPIIGSAFEVSKLREKFGMFCLVINELCRIYDTIGVVGLKIGKDKVVVVNSLDSIKEMMTNEDLDGRPVGLFYETRTFGSRKGIILVDEDFWQEQRRFIARHLKNLGFARRNMAEMIQNEAQYLLEDFNTMIKNTDVDNNKSIAINLQQIFQVYVLNTLWLMIAGIRYDRENKEVGEMLSMFNELFKNIDMIGCLFSHFPLLRYIAPEYSGYSNYVEIHRRFYAFLKCQVDRHRQTFSLTDEPRDLMDKYLHMMAMPLTTDLMKETFNEQQLLAVCLDMFLAGSETTNKGLGFAFLHLVRNPQVQEKAQAELDMVVGRERQPTWNDKPNLPYCDAIIHEALRIFMGHTFSVPHRALRDTRLCGYFIPKDTMVISSFCGMLMNEKNFPNPKIFQPERFIKDNKLFVPDAFAPFGVGKHRCMGEIMGKQNLFLFVTTMLQNFKFLPNNANEIPDDEPIDGATAAIKPFIALVVKR